MNTSTAEKMTDNFEWGTRRSAGLRHSVTVSARILGQSGDPIVAEILNISSNGMFLGYDLLVPQGGPEPLKVGTTISIAFEPDLEGAPEDTIILEAEIMRQQPHGIGVHLLDMTKEQRAAIQKMAIAVVDPNEPLENQPRYTAPSKKTGQQPDPKAITRQCRKILERHLPSMIWALRTEVSKRLRHADKDPEEQRLGAADADLMEQKASAVGRTIERRVMLAFAELGGLDSTQELVFTSPAAADANKPNTPLGLVAHDDAEKSAGLQATVRRVQATVQRQSFEVNIRLADVLGHRVDNEENPLLPGVMCRMLWDSTIEYCDTPRVQRHLQEAIWRRIAPLLTDLYDDLEAVLDEYGVRGAFSS